MDKQKQIEEMVEAVYPWLKEVPIDERKQLRENVSGLMVMERLYNAGYRKIPENAVVLTREEYGSLVTRPSLNTAIDVFAVRKETAEKFAERLKSLFDIEQWYTVADNKKVHKAIDEICKEITEGCV